MPSLHGEKTFESLIEKHLIDRNGFLRGDLADYDKRLCLLNKSLVRFLQMSQPEEWREYSNQAGADAESNVCKRVAKVVESKGTHHILTKGFSLDGRNFKMCFMPAVSGLNPDVERLFETNLFEVIRDDFKYSEANEKSVDMVIFLNGLPLFTMELKNPLTGQTFLNAIAQYRKTRDPKEPLFLFQRCLAHFAVDTEEVHFTTKLAWGGTRFLPFNQGNDGGKGNHPRATGPATSYLWEEVWQRKSILNLIQRFIRVVKERDKKGKATGKYKLIFPRYQQMDTVRKLSAHAREHGPGQQYLNQHSAGSGKTICIATLANSLAVLHNDQDVPVFNTVIVVSDRRVIDRQLQSDLADFTDVRGVLENIDGTSRQLREALEDGKKIVVCTIQKFPHILSDLRELKQQTFAVIIDEAHSSQSGKAAAQLNQALSRSNETETESEEVDDWEETVNKAMKAVGRLSNVSYFAFTATPKDTTFQLFGVKQPNGDYKPFTKYSMRQAIEEGFILDVLKNYTSYEQYFALLKKVEEDPRVDKAKAKKLLKRYVANATQPIEIKCEIMIDHYRDQVMKGIGGKAKAMIVANGRANAVRYFLKTQSYLAEIGSPFKVLVAFTGTVKLEETPGKEYTESNLNGIAETQTADQFEDDEYRILIVANKYQTGFDQPLLQGMYVDRKLDGVTAVQTLSRLNRMCNGKSDTFVLDFENRPQDIRASFQKYYDSTFLEKGTDPNVLYDIKSALDDYEIYSSQIVEELSRCLYSNLQDERKRAKIEALLRPVVDQFRSLEQDDRVEFRSKMRDYVKAYGFLAQIIPFEDLSLFKFYDFSQWLSPMLPAEESNPPTEILGFIDLDLYKPELQGTQDLELERGNQGMDPRDYGEGATIPEEELEQLSKIISEINDAFGTTFTPDDRIIISRLQEQLKNDDKLENLAKNSSKNATEKAFEEVAFSLLGNLIDSDFKFYKKVQDDEKLSKFLFSKLFESYYKDKKSKKDKK